ncbi:complement resistance protein TraT [Burkholderia ubonensis]|uniref:complement resistance protein TraT n=1 Tax=Burkholderia ubonensis TaxID=101571 RepID=UPI000A4B6C92|nr:complement resistance protein TraT [Burkholderia ubonensis]
MISHPPTFVLIGLGVALVAMFGFGFYWLATKDRPTRPLSPVTPSPARGGAGTRVADVDESDEWEAFAPYPDHVVQAAHEATIESHDSYPPFGRHEEPVHASPASEARHDLHGAIESLMGEPDKPAPPQAAASSSGPTIRCPRCLSSRIDTRNRARKAGSTIGSVAGATGGMVAALAGAETGAVVGSIAGPVGTVFGGLAGAVIAGLVGSATGCAAGSAVGAAIDDNVLDNHNCLACGHAFSAAQS